MYLLFEFSNLSDNEDGEIGNFIDVINLGKSVKKSLNAWKSGVLKDQEVEYKLFKLIRSLICGIESIQNRKAFQAAINDELASSELLCTSYPYSNHERPLFRQQGIDKTVQVLLPSQKH